MLTSCTHDRSAGAKANYYEKHLRPWLFRIDPEEAHRLVHLFGRIPAPLWKLIGRPFQYRQDDLRVNLAGIQLSNPVGLAAGFDKNADLVHMLGYVGFGSVEIGSVTAKPWVGNAKPRLFRLEDDRALINRLGLNSKGADQVAEHLAHTHVSLPVGLNIAKTNDPAIAGEAAIEDMLYTFKRLKCTPISYVSLNASCPNTKEKIKEHKRDLAILFDQVQRENERNLPVFVKLSPDSPAEFIEWMVEAGIEQGLAGYICGNSSVFRNDLRTSDERVQQIGIGGLTGPPLKRAALNLCRLVYKLKSPNQVIIGCGGISSGQDAYDFICAGASAVQVYTALVYRGPTLANEINCELSSLLRRDGLSLADAVGIGIYRQAQHY